MAFYPAIPASDGTSMTPPENAEFKVFELSDTARATPLPLLSTAGLNAAPLVTTGQGVLPPVNVVSPNVRHVFKSGEWEWERQSFDGAQEATQSAAAAALAARQAAEEAAADAKGPADEAVARGITRANIPQMVAQEVGSQPAVTQAAAAAVNATPKIAEIEARLPYEGVGDGLIAGFVDAAGRETWLGARESDGGPSEWAMEHLRRRLGIEDARQETDVLFSVTDAEMRMTDLTVRSSDGQVPDWVMRRWAARLNLAGGGGGRILPTDKYLRGSELLPMITDMTRASGWGSSSMEGIASYLTPALSAFGVRFQGEGKRGEQSQQVAARLGSTPALLTFPGNVIPAAGSTTVTANIPGYQLKKYSGTIAGVHGELSYASPNFTFTRSQSGETVSTSANTPFVPDVGMAYRDAVALLWMGKNDAGNVDDGREAGIVARTDQAFDWLAPQTKRALVLGHFMDTGTPAGSIERKQLTAVNAAHAARYGDQFLDVQEILSSPTVWESAGIAPTAQDHAEQSLGNKPPSLSADAGHLNAAGYAAVAIHIIQRMTSLGWYAN